MHYVNYIRTAVLCVGAILCTLTQKANAQMPWQFWPVGTIIGVGADLSLPLPYRVDIPDAVSLWAPIKASFGNP